MTYDELMACKIEQELIYLDQISDLMRERDEAREVARKLMEVVERFAPNPVVVNTRRWPWLKEPDGSTSE